MTEAWPGSHVSPAPDVQSVVAASFRIGPGGLQSHARAFVLILSCLPVTLSHWSAGLKLQGRRE